MYVRQKKLMAKCRACGNENQLDSSHRAGSHLIKHVPKDMSEIDGKKVEEEKKEETTQQEKPAEEEAVDNSLKLDSEEIGKCFYINRGKSSIQ